MKLKYFLFSFFIGLFTLFSQYEVPEKPSFQTSVYDYVNLLSSTQKRILENKLIKYSDSTSTQIVVGIINSTKGESIGILTPRWAHKWGIGQEKEDNGIFILLAKEDRKVWIAPGYGVEHKLTAGITGEIVRNIMVPEFKKGDYYSGLNNASEAIFEILKGTYQGTRKDSSNFDPGSIIFIFIIIIFYIIVSRGNNKRNRGGGRYRNTDSLETIILSNAGRNQDSHEEEWYSGGGWSSGGGWDSGDSGGFGGGFGGGGFSGGGAGGSW